MKTLVLYHANCPDGFAAAWAAWRALGDDAEYIPCSYGHEPPDVTGARVFIVDFSFKRDVMFKLLYQAETITLLDHHITAQQDLADLEHPRFFFTFDMNKSGATLTWEHFHGDEPCWIVKYAEDRDLWRHALPRTKEVNAYLQAGPKNLRAYDTCYRLGMEAVADMGAGCLAWMRYYIDATKECARRMPFLGHADIPVVNAPYTATSEVVGELAELDGVPFAVGWHQRSSGQVVYSLRSRGDFDVSAIAVLMGGGGHRKAAGFSSERFPWELAR